MHTSSSDEELLAHLCIFEKKCFFLDVICENERFEMIKEDELALIFESCFMNYNLLNNTLNVTFDGPSCIECISVRDQELEYRAYVYRNSEYNLRGVNVSFKCVKKLRKKTKSVM